MERNKTYIKSALALQMILIPVLLTIGLFGLIAFEGQFVPYSIGKDTAQLIYLLIAFIVPTIVGGIVGFIFKENIKHKITSAKWLHIVSIIPIIYALIFATLAVIISPNNYNSTWWGVYVFKNPFLLIFHFIFFFGGSHYHAIVAEIMGYTGFGVGMYLNEILSKVDLHDDVLLKTKKGYVIGLIIPIAFCGIITREVFSNGMIEFRYGETTIGKDLNEYDLYEIAPFKENNGLAKLDQPASLKFTDFDTMPRLDGATAAYPVYAAFVEAVYEGLGDYYKNNSDYKPPLDGTTIAYPVSKDNYEKDMYSAFVSSENYPLNIVKCTKTGTAYERLINGDTDIIFVAEPSKSHVELIEEKGDAFVLTPIGSEAFVFFTNAQNPVDDLTIEELQDIYSGKITNWKEVDGKNKSILPYQRPENSGSQTVMQNQVMKDVKMLPPTKETYAGGMGEIISQVAGYKNAKNSIGYSFMYYSTEMIKNNQIKHISINGIKPSAENIRNKTYPFTVPVYAVTLKSNENENVKKFIEWVLSDEGQSLVEKTGYIGK